MSTKKKKQSGLQRAARGPMPAAPLKPGYQPTAKPVGYHNLKGHQKPVGAIPTQRATGAVYNPTSGKTILTYGKQPKAKGAVYNPATGMTALTY